VHDFLRPDCRMCPSQGTSCNPPLLLSQEQTE
jgi:hypothetical protein